MNEIILNYIAQAVLGGASGYITNDYAINMLFKEYTPLKIGGVIKKTRSEFINNLSSMVENDIINAEKFQQILNDECLKKEFDAMTSDFYKSCLYDAVGNNRLQQIKGFDKTLESTDTFISNIINEYMPDLYEIMLDKLDPCVFLTPKQLSNISNSIYSEVYETINTSNIIKDTLMSIYRHNSDLVLGNIIDRNIYENIIGNIIEILLNKYPEKFKTIIYEALDSLGIKESLKSAENVFYDKKIGEIVMLDEIPENLHNRISSYVDSKEGTERIGNLIISIFSFGKNCDKSLFDLLDSSFESSLKIYLTDNIPYVTENIIDWIKENSNLIDTMIEQSMDEVVKESDGLKAKLLSTIKTVYLNNLSKKYSLADKIISYIRKISDSEKLENILSDKLIDLLESLTIREIIEEAEKNNITPEKISSFIVNYIKENSRSFINSFTEYIEEKKVGDIFSAELIRNEVLPGLMKQLSEFLPSETVKNYLTQIAANGTSCLLDEELRYLFNEKQAECSAEKLSLLIGEATSSMEDSIKKWIGINAENLAVKLTSESLNLETIDALNDSLYKAYINGAEKLRPAPVSSVLDKLNSIDDLVENSSDSLRTYAVDNSGIILNGSIKAIVSDNLNKLDDKALVNLANDFIGRELKPIMYFGGILGIAAGLILAAFHTVSPGPTVIRAANMAAYALVGYMTNVIAINMIFKPYRKNKLLSKLPFFRNFSLGYIIKNQSTFAQKTAQFIDKNLLNKKSISELFDKYEHDITNAFTKSIADNNYKTIGNLLTNNKNNIVNKLYSYLKGMFEKSAAKLGEFLYNKIAPTRLLNLINKSTIIKISSEFKKAIGNNSSFVNSKSTLNSKFSGEFIKDNLATFNNSCYGKLNNALANDTLLTKEILKYENKYQLSINKLVKEIIGTEATKNIVDKVSEKTAGAILNKDSRHKAIYKVMELVNTNSDNKTLGEIFDGRIKQYIDSNTPKILNKVSGLIVKSINESKKKISFAVQSEIKNNLGFIEKSMYTVIGGDGIVDELLAKIIDDKVPQFFEEKSDELQTVFYSILNEKLYTVKAEYVYSNLSGVKLNELADIYFDSDKAKSQVTDSVNHFVGKIGNINLSEFLKFLRAGSLEELQNVYYDEINSFSDTLHSSISQNKELIIERMTELTDTAVDEFMKSEFREIFKGISETNVTCTIQKLFAELDKNGFDEILQSAASELISELNIDAGSILNKDEFVNSSALYIHKLLENPEFENAVNSHISSVIDEAVSENFNFIDGNFKEYILNTFTVSCINSLKRNMDKILKSVEFDKIAMEEIEKMEPEKIHEMFDSFAGGYFKKLMFYGLGGFVFGINTYVGFALASLKILAELINLNKKKDKK